MEGDQLLNFFEQTKVILELLGLAFKNRIHTFLKVGTHVTSYFRKSSNIKSCWSCIGVIWKLFATAKAYL